MSRSHPTATPQVLLVEDESSLRTCLEQFLQDHGYQTVTAQTLKQGLELLHECRPWLCLLDLNLPDGSGMELLKKVAASAQRCRVIVMTAFDLKHLRPANTAAVLAGWMDKPVDPARLLEMVKAEDGRRDGTISDAGRTCPCG